MCVGTQHPHFGRANPIFAISIGFRPQTCWPIPIITASQFLLVNSHRSAIVHCHRQSNYQYKTVSTTFCFSMSYLNNRVGNGGPSGSKAVRPQNYVPGLGRGAAGFTTRSDVGPAANVALTAESTGGSRAADARAAKLQAQKQKGLFGDAPQNYVPGAGRGAGSMGAAGTGGPATATVGSYDAFGGYQERPVNEVPGQYDEDDDEADRIWAAIDERVQSRKRKSQQRKEETVATSAETDNARVRIGSQFRELKEKLKDVSEDQWAAIPDVGDHSIKHKRQRQQQNEMFTPLSDTLLEQRNQANLDATAGNTALAGTTTAADGNHTTGVTTTMANMSGLSAARGTVLGMSLDKMSDSVSGQTNVDPQGYLTSLGSSTTTLNNASQVADIHKARLLLKSVRDTNPQHGPGWIASARVEETAGKLLQARKIIQEGTRVCPDNEDVWLEAARLHPIPVAKSILATAVRRIPTSIQIFLKAASLETADSAKKAVLRKALEANPTSTLLWKAAIDLEEADDARVLLAVAVEKVPQDVDLWLALARLETYQSAQKVLNKARKALPSDRSVWLAAAKLEESQDHVDTVSKIVDRAVRSLRKQDAVISREQWLEEAEKAESADAPITSAAIIHHTIGQDVEEEDCLRTWSEDAKACVARGSVVTARSILAHALRVFPSKRVLWMQAVELERQHGTAVTLEERLRDATQALPRVEIFWLLRAKEQWMAGKVDEARQILTDAFAANPDSESVWLAAAKLEWENDELERARVLFARARERAPTARVYMKSAILEREQKCFGDALKLVEEGIDKYPKFAKLYMIGGQIYADDMPKHKGSLDRARKFYQRGLEACLENVTLWKLASRLEESAWRFDAKDAAGESDKAVSNGNVVAKPGAAGATKARSLLELARLKNPKNAELWLEAVRLERRNGSLRISESLLAKALQECPTSGMLLAETIWTAPRATQKSKSADAIQRCPDDPQVIVAVASLFASERKHEKARKWFDRAVTLNPDLGDSWVRYYVFELQWGTVEQQGAVKERCIAAEPKHGELWASTRKEVTRRHESIGEGLEVAAQKLRNAQESENPSVML